VYSLALDATGNVYAGGGIPPHGLPTRTPLYGGFGPSTGFLSEFSADLSTLLFSTFLGDNETFTVQGIAIGSGGSVVIGGATPASIYVNSIAPAAPPSLRVDSIRNAASVVDGPLSPGETVYVRGADFTSDAQLMIGGAAVSTLSINATQITAVLPSTLSAGAATVQVQSGGAISNQVLVPVAIAVPGIFSADASGLGQGYILNHDETLNTPSNPAMIGEQITIYANGVGAVSFTQGYAVTASPVSVFIDGFYCNGVAAVMGPVAGFSGSVYQLTVIVPIRRLRIPI